MVGIFGEEVPDVPGGGEEPIDPVEPSDGYECFFKKEGGTNPFYTISGNTANNKGSATVNGESYTWCLKMETATSVQFTITKAMTLILVFASESTPNIRIDGTKISSSTSNIITYNLEAGAHALTKADTNNLFYINLTTPTGIEDIFFDEEEKEGLIYDLQGRVVKSPQKGIFIKNGKKFFIK